MLHAETRRVIKGYLGGCFNRFFKTLISWYHV